VAYVRWSAESFLYIYEHIDGGIECCGCPFGAGGCYRAPDGPAMADHVRAHVAAGHDVPHPDELVEKILERAQLH
jgi:hypothetical protein